MPYQLLIADAEGNRQPRPLSGRRLSLGRAVDNDLSYPEDTGLSRHHLVLEKIGEQWWARDLGSKNGTFINEQPVRERVLLHDGDRITVSSSALFSRPLRTSRDRGQSSSRRLTPRQRFPQPTRSRSAN